MPLGMEVGLEPGDFVFDGTQLSPGKRAHPPLTQFLAHVYCGQTAGWIKMPLGTQVNVGPGDVGPGDVVLDGVAAPHKRGTTPSFRFMSIVANDWMDEDATWYGNRNTSIAWSCACY